MVLFTDPLGFRTRYEYDGQNRQITIVRDLNTNGPSPTDTGDIVMRQVWDDSSRLVQRIDDNTNVTTYAYDALNRLVREIRPDRMGRTNT